MPANKLRGRSMRRLATVACVLVATALVIVRLPASSSRGSIVEQRLGADLTWEAGSKTEVQASNHVNVPQDGAVEIELTGGAKLSAKGPSRFELAFEEKRWKVVVLQGHVRARTPKAGAIVVVNRRGRAILPAGSHLLTSETTSRQDQQRKKLDVDAMIAEGQRLFFLEPPKMAAAAKLFRAADEDPRATAQQRESALFYFAASQGRQELFEKAIEAQEAWLGRYPTSSLRPHVLLFYAHYHAKLGKAKEARRIREQIVKEYPDSSTAEHVRPYLTGAAVDQVGARGTVAKKEGPLQARLPATRHKAGPYLVVEVGLRATRSADAGYRAAAKSAMLHHAATRKAVRALWDGEDIGSLRRILRQHRPQNVLFVLRPETLDVKLHRRILLESAKIDADIFADFSFGYLTARTGDGVKALWRRIQRLHKKGLSSKRWHDTGVTPGPRSMQSAGRLPPIARAAGFRGAGHLYGIKDPELPKFIDETLAQLERAAVIQMTGNGDPQGIWLFDDHRNIDRSKHWPYRADKVGFDPDNEMPRLMASRFRALRLASPIVWSGTCHSGATCRVFVEGDIVSTFGRTEVATVHRLAPKKSMALALLDGGAAALLVPIASNHGMSVSMESDFALRWSASLGETLKSTYDDVLLAAEGKLVLDLPDEGKPHRRGEPIMQGGGSNRILIGDPALSPFPRAEHPNEKVSIEETKDGFRVIVERSAGWVARAWDIYGTDRSADWRVIVRVDLEKLGGSRGKAMKFTCDASASRGQTRVPFSIRHCAAENYHGRRYLHLQANANRKQVQGKAVRVVFTVKVNA